METVLGEPIKEDTVAILYLCKFNKTLNTMSVKYEAQFNNRSSALQSYANIPNPESQLVTGKTREELKNNLKRLHDNMKDPEWLEDLRDCI